MGIFGEKKGGDTKKIDIRQELVDKKERLAADAAEKNLNTLLEECKASGKYMIFAATRSKEKDEHGNFRIHYRYIRRKFAFEDAYRSTKVLKDELLKDLDPTDK